MNSLQPTLPVSVEVADHGLADEAGPPPASMAMVPVHEDGKRNPARLDQNASTGLAVFDDDGLALLGSLG